MEKFIKVPRWVYRGIRKNDLGFGDYNLISGDVEIRPHKILGVYGKEKKIIEYTKEDICAKFLSLLQDACERKKTNICFFHHLGFDAQIIFQEFGGKFLENEFTLWFEPDFSPVLEEKVIEGMYYFENDRAKYKKFVKVSVFSGKIWFIRVDFGNGKRCLILDSLAHFFSGMNDHRKNGLWALAKELNLPHKKTFIDFDKYCELPEAIKYLENDLDIEKDLGNYILEDHKKYSVKICESGAKQAERILRHKFLKNGDILPFPPTDYLKGAILSSHGGKNALYVPQGRYKNVRLYDFNSYYPYAMTQIPNFLKCNYGFVDNFDEKRPGIYKVYGRMNKVKYSPVFTHDFWNVSEGYRTNKEYVVDEGCSFYIDGLWLTSYELEEAMRTNDFALEKCYGYSVEETEERNPLKEYVEYFYTIKVEAEDDSVEYLSAKLKLNFLAGKFFQNVKHGSSGYYRYDPAKKGLDDEFIWEEGEYSAGGMFNPIISSLITGFCRADITKMEKKYNSLHTSTDAIMTTSRIQTSKKLGELRFVGDGDLQVFRNNLWILYAPKIKYALHGFYGSVEKLLMMYLNGEKTYTKKRFINIREGILHNNPKMCDFDTLEYKLGV